MLKIKTLTEAHRRNVVTSKLLPAIKDIPEEFMSGYHELEDVVQGMFFSGKGKSLEDFGLTPKEGVDLKLVMPILNACLSSFEPSHEHKISGVAYMLSEWFDYSKP